MQAAEITGTSDEIRKLESACFKLARTTKWARRPVDSDSILLLARDLSQIAKSRAEYGQTLGIDVPLVIRAVLYLHQVHAIPPMGSDTQWFSNMLDAVLEIARPNSAVCGEARAFLRDLLEGLGTSIDETDG